MNKIFVFAFNHDNTKSPAISYKGFYDGEKFVPKTGFKTDDLFGYDCVQLFGNDGFRSSIPKRFNKSLLEQMERAFVELYGEEQINLF